MSSHRIPGTRLAVSFLAAAALLIGSAAPCFPYALEGESWPDGPINMVLQITPSMRPLTDGKASLNDSAADALTTWNQYLERSQFAFTLRTPAEFVTPQDGDNVNTVFSSDSVYGDTFGSGTLAVTLLSFEETTLQETDVLINTHYNFDSYAGPLHRTGLNAAEDLHRILLHEFGHVLGLDHPDQAGQTVDAIMNSRISDLDHLTDDDIAGGHYLYDQDTTGGGGTNSPASFARIKAGKFQISKIVYSRATGNIYTIGQKRGNGINQLVVYDPYTLAVLDTPAFTCFPTNLAISDDGRYLYIAYVSSTTATPNPTRVSRLDLFTNLVDEDFALVAPAASLPDGDAAAVPVAIDMQVAPGQPDVLAVSQNADVKALTTASGYYSVVIYNQGQPLPNAATFQQAAKPELQFAGQGTLLLATPTRAIDPIRILSVNQTGVTPGSTPSSGATTDATHYVIGGNLLLGTSGQAISPINGSVVRQILPPATFVFNLAADSVANRVFYVTNTSSSLLAYSLPDGTSLGSVTLPPATEGTFQGASLIPWGQRGLAYGSTSVRGVFVARSVTFDGDPLAGGTPDILTVKAPVVSSIAQNSGQALKFRVRRESATSDSSQELTVHYTVTGTAVNGVNFKPLTGTVVIPALRSQAKIKLVPLPDRLTDGPVTVTISLAADPNYVVAAPATATVAITQ